MTRPLSKRTDSGLDSAPTSPTLSHSMDRDDRNLEIRARLRAIGQSQRFTSFEGGFAMARDNGDDGLSEVVRMLRQRGIASPQTVEEMLLQLVLNPNRLKIERTILAQQVEGGVLGESREGTVMNAQGFLEEVKEQKFFMLDDGTSTSSVVICQTCGGTVKESNLKRCPCGQTVCLRKGCARGGKHSEQWFCCTAHRFLYFVGFSLR